MDIISYALSKKGMQQSVSDYLDEHLTNPTNPPLDTSLTIANAAADSKATGDKLSELKEDLSAMSTATSSDVGKALKAKTVTDGKVTEWEFGEAGGTNISCDVDANGNATLSLGEEDLSDIAELVGGTA